MAGFLTGVGIALLILCGAAATLGAMIGFALYQMAAGDRARAEADEAQGY